MGTSLSRRKRKGDAPTHHLVSTPAVSARRATIASPPKKRRVTRTARNLRNETVTPSRASRGVPRVVTPSSEDISTDLNARNVKSRTTRRALLQAPPNAVVAAESDELPPRFAGDKSQNEPSAKRKLIMVPPCQGNVRTAYALIRKLTGSVGGNGSFGAIYGELTMGSMQKMIELMKIHTGFDSSSRFIDVGSGLGKPSIHVSQDPGVAFSYGIEMERSRWSLGMANLKAVVDAAWDQSSLKSLKDDEKLGYSCYFQHGNIKFANSFDPFTHVYMFSIG